jgi:hypothetical protein
MLNKDCHNYFIAVGDKLCSGGMDQASRPKGGGNPSLATKGLSDYSSAALLYDC